MKPGLRDGMHFDAEHGVVVKERRLPREIQEEWQCVAGHSMKTQTLTLFAAPKITPHDARVHAMKNCLSTIRAVVHLLQGDLPPRSRERFDRLAAASLRLDELIECDLRVEHDGDPKEPPASAGPPPACVASLVESVTARLLDRAELNGVELFVQ